MSFSLSQLDSHLTSEICDLHLRAGARRAAARPGRSRLRTRRQRRSLVLSRTPQGAGRTTVHVETRVLLANMNTSSRRSQRRWLDSGQRPLQRPADDPDRKDEDGWRRRWSRCEFGCEPPRAPCHLTRPATCIVHAGLKDLARPQRPRRPRRPRPLALPTPLAPSRAPPPRRFSSQTVLGKWHWPALSDIQCRSHQSTPNPIVKPPWLSVECPHCAGMITRSPGRCAGRAA